MANGIYGNDIYSTYTMGEYKLNDGWKEFENGNGYIIVRKKNKDGTYTYDGIIGGDLGENAKLQFDFNWGDNEQDLKNLINTQIGNDKDEALADKKLNDAVTAEDATTLQGIIDAVKENGGKWDDTLQAELDKLTGTQARNAGQNLKDNLQGADYAQDDLDEAIKNAEEEWQLTLGDIALTEEKIKNNNDSNAEIMGSNMAAAEAESRKLRQLTAGKKSSSVYTAAYQIGENAKKIRGALVQAGYLINTNAKTNVDTSSNSTEAFNQSKGILADLKSNISLDAYIPWLEKDNQVDRANKNHQDQQDAFKTAQERMNGGLTDALYSGETNVDALKDARETGVLANDLNLFMNNWKEEQAKYNLEQQMPSWADVAMTSIQVATSAMSFGTGLVGFGVEAGWLARGTSLGSLIGGWGRSLGGGGINPNYDRGMYQNTQTLTPDNWYGGQQSAGANSWTRGGYN